MPRGEFAGRKCGDSQFGHGEHSPRCRCRCEPVLQRPPTCTGRCEGLLVLQAVTGDDVRTAAQRLDRTCANCCLARSAERIWSKQNKIRFVCLPLQLVAVACEAQADLLGIRIAGSADTSSRLHVLPRPGQIGEYVLKTQIVTTLTGDLGISAKLQRFPAGSDYIFRGSHGMGQPEASLLQT